MIIFVLFLMMFLAIRQCYVSFFLFNQKSIHFGFSFLKSKREPCMVTVKNIGGIMQIDEKIGTIWKEYFFNTFLC